MNDRFNRNILSFGAESFNTIQVSSVLIVGMNVVGTETAINLILSGCTNIGLLDTENITENDVNSNFYVKPTDIGQKRSEIIKSNIQYLNPNCAITIENELNDETLHKYMAVIQTNPLKSDEIQKLNEKCRINKQCFIYVDAYMYFGMVFIDFCDEFVVNNIDGDPPKIFKVSSVTNSNPGKVIFSEANMRYYKDMCGKFIQMDSMPELNNLESVKLQKKSGVFEIIDTSNFSKFDPNKKSGFFVEIKQKQTLNFQSYHEALPKSPKNRAWIRNFFLNRQKSDPILNYNQPLGVLLGAVAANEFIKFITHRILPIDSQFFLICFEDLFVSKENIKNTFSQIEDTSNSKENTLNQNENFIDYNFIETRKISLENEKLMLVGVGALGCTVAKIASLYKPKLISLIDADSIELSNLNRQLLFSADDVSRNKAEVAKEKILKYRENIEINSYNAIVANSTRNIFNNKFFTDHTAIFGLVDSFQARYDISRFCLYAQKPFFTGGIGAKTGDWSAWIPFRTCTYEKPSENNSSTPSCTLRSFPHTPEHCIEWAHNELLKYMNTKKFNDFDSIEKFCIKKFKSKFYYGILNLTSVHPSNELRNGIPYWSGKRIYPDLIKFDKNNEFHRKFMKSLMTILCKNNSIKVPSDIDSKIDKIEIEYTDELPTKKAINDDENVKNDFDENRFKKHFDSLDDDQGDFIYACSNIRSTNYSLPVIDRLQAIKHAAKIQPMLPTMNSIVSSMIFFSYLVHLAEPSVAFNSNFSTRGMELALRKQCRVIEKKLGASDQKFTEWDLFKFDSNTKIVDAIKEIEERTKCDFVSWSTSDGLLIPPFTPNDRLNLKEKTFKDVIKTEQDIVIIDPFLESNEVRDVLYPFVMVNFAI